MELSHLFKMIDSNNNGFIDYFGRFFSSLFILQNL